MKRFLIWLLGLFEKDTLSTLDNIVGDIDSALGLITEINISLKGSIEKLDEVTAMSKATVEELDARIADEVTMQASIAAKKKSTEAVMKNFNKLLNLNMADGDQE